MAETTHAAQAVPTVAPDFLAAMEEASVQPLWDRYHKILVGEPRSPDQPHLWRWRELQGFIRRAAAEVDMAQAERRVLMLVNPAFGGKVVTTTNLFAGIQILEPGEKARPHRHTASAMRFIIEGKGGATIVNGQRCEMLAGDLILTPNWAWHEHVNDGSERVVWLDALDLPLSASMDVVFAQGGQPNSYEANVAAMPDGAFAMGGLVPVSEAPGVPYSPMFRYPWAATIKALAATPPAGDGSRRIRYTNPVDGGPVMPTIDCYAWQLARNKDTYAYRSTANAVCLAVDGKGMSKVGGKTIAWERHDVFSVPHWNWTTHHAISETAHLFMFTDREVLRRMNFLREEVQAPPST